MPPEVPAATVTLTLAVPATTVGAGGVPGTDTVDDDVAGVAVTDTASDPRMFQSDVPAVFVARTLATYEPGVRPVTSQNPDAPVTVHLPANGVFASLGFKGPYTITS